jgi:tetratricopeptide (TPR) repeat protein
MGHEFTEREATEYNAAYEEGVRLIEKEIYVHEARPDGPPGWFAQRKLKKAIDCFEQALRINPEAWQAMWCLGKIHQRLGNDQLELSWFRRAHRLAPTEPDVCREAAHAAMNVGRAEEGIGFCRSAIEASPDDPGLKANLALALVLAGKHDEAQTAAREAATANPQDQVSRQVLEVIRDIRAGKRPQPRTLKEMKEWL